MSLIKNLVLDCDNYKHHLQYVHLVILSSVLKITVAPTSTDIHLTLFNLSSTGKILLKFCFDFFIVFNNPVY